MKNRDIHHYLTLKHFLDFVLSLLLLILLIPLFIIISILIKISSKGPVIFKQYRLGKNGKKFKMYKFRSMVVDAENSSSTTVPNDIRITKLGKFLRITNIDELPQLINILKGEISLIGPRPISCLEFEYEDFSKEQQKRFKVRPGITGLAQINGRKSLDLDKKCEYDIQYVNSICFGLDLKIFFLTLLVLLKDNY